MTGNDLHDDDLRSRFMALRREEEAQAPEFGLPSPRSERPVGRRFVGLAVVGGSLAMIALAVFLMPLAQRKRPSQPVVSLTEWQSATDFLLETPGQELLRTVPTIGDWRGYAPAPGQRLRNPQVRKQASPLRRKRS